MWGRDGAPAGKATSNAWKDRIRAQGVLSQATRTASPYRRMKLVMDYWCALWFWPIRESERLPSRQEFLNEVSLVLTGSVYQPGVGTQVRSLFGDDYADAEHAADIAQRITDEVGMLDLEKLFEQFPRLRFVDELARRRRFHHWELAFADLFYGAGRDGKARGGFDLVVGNPPWIKVEWEERGVLGERNPAFALRKLPAAELSKQRAAAFDAASKPFRITWLSPKPRRPKRCPSIPELPQQNYPAYLTGQQSQSVQVLSAARDGMIAGIASGVAGFLHPDGVYNDPKAGAFRAALYPRLRAHFQFQNERRLFADVGITTIRVQRERVRRSPWLHRRDSSHHLEPLLPRRPWTLASTTTETVRCLGFKDEDGRWTTARSPRNASHHDGSIRCALDVPSLPYRSEAGTIAVQRRRLPSHFTRHLPPECSFQECLTGPPATGGSWALISCTHPRHWDETRTHKRDGTIRREDPLSRREVEELVLLRTAHFFVGNPVSKTPRQRVYALSRTTTTR